MFDLLLIGFLQAIVIAWLVGKRFKNVTLIGPLVLLSSKKGLKWMARLAKKFKVWWNVYADFGIILGFGVFGAWHVFKNQSTPKRILYSFLAPLFLIAPFLTLLIMPSILPEVSAANADLVAMGILYVFGYSFGILYLLGSETFALILEYLSGTPVIARVGPALPGVNVSGSPLQGIPLYGWLVFPLLLFVHEVSHGILTKVNEWSLSYGY